MPYLTIHKGITFINPIFVSEEEMKNAYKTNTNPYGKECPDIDPYDMEISQGRQLQWHWWQIELGLNKKK